LGSPFRLYRRQEIILPGGNMKSMFIFVASTLLAALAGAQPQYTVTDLGTLGGPGTNSNPFGLSAIGWASGSSNSVANGPQHAFLWYGFGLLNDLGTLGGQKCTTCNSQANGLNALGQTAVGSETLSVDPNGEDFCGYGTHHQCLGAIGGSWGLTALPPLPGGNNANAFDVNNRGQVVGVAENGTSDATCVSGGTAFQVLRFEAISWQLEGRIRELHPLPGDTVGFATGINANGQAVGASGLCSNTAYQSPAGPFAPHAVMWDNDGSPTDLGHLENTPAGVYTSATSINDRGDVVGFACVGANTNPATYIEDAFLWTKATGMQDLGRLSGAIASGPPCCHTVNNSGVIVGISIDANFNETAVIWQNKMPVDLNTLIPANSGWFLECAQGINDAGEIIGFGTINGATHAFRATPRN
jgi:probable HAF family extracellular repeat protein